MNNSSKNVNYIAMYIEKFGEDGLPVYIDIDNADAVNEMCKECLERDIPFSSLFPDVNPEGEVWY